MHFEKCPEVRNGIWGEGRRVIISLYMILLWVGIVMKYTLIPKEQKRKGIFYLFSSLFHYGVQPMFANFVVFTELEYMFHYRALLESGVFIYSLSKLK